MRDAANVAINIEPIAKSYQLTSIAGKVKAPISPILAVPTKLIMRNSTMDTITIYLFLKTTRTKSLNIFGIRKWFVLTLPLFRSQTICSN